MAIYFGEAGNGLVKLELGGEPVTFEGKLVVAAVPEGSAGFDGVKRMDTNLFQQTGAKLGCALMLAN